ncbi:MAG: cysteine desulfurase family protein [Candidatus Omnitrophota bacterium]
MRPCFFIPMHPIYLDNHATTPLDPRVLRAMMPYLKGKFGNAASRTHLFGRESRRGVEKARAQVARLIGAEAREIVFTSGATEANNLAIKGVVQARPGRGGRLLTVVTEHKSVLDPCKRLSLSGFRITALPVRRDGLVDLGKLKEAIRRDTVLISVMLANNEIGVIQPIARMARIAKKRGILFHCDAAQAVGKIPVNVKMLGVDLMSFTAHKLYGPKGVGALYVRKKGEPQVRLVPLLDGGGHEVGLRSGTLNVAGIVGFGEACEIARRGLAAELRKLARLRDRLRDGILRGVPDAVVNGSEKNRLPNNLNVSLPGVRAEALMKKIPNVAVSSGSACLSTSPVPSHVLRALGMRDELARCAIRFGIGRFNTTAEMDSVIRKVVSAVKRLRSRAA